MEQKQLSKGKGEAMRKLKTVILAAGMGTRMKSDKPKCLHEVLGYPMLYYVIQAARECGSDEICVVIGHKGELVKEAFQNEKDLTFVVQAEQKGTGHAVMMALDFIGEEESDVLILFGDTPLIRGSVLQKMRDAHTRQHNAVTVLSTVLEDPTGYGRILRDDQNRFLGSVEHKDATPEQLQCREVNSGMYCFRSEALRDSIGKINNNNKQGEYYLPDTLKILLEEDKKAEALMTRDTSVVKGVNNRMQLLESQDILRHRINRAHMENGITILDQQSILISPEAEIGRDSKIYPGTIIEGKTIIGEGCVIGPNAHLVDAKLGNDVRVENAVIRGASIPDGTEVEPFRVIRA